MNIFNIENFNTPDEITDILFKSKNVRIERIVSNGQTSPENFWYDQSQDEWIVVLQGKGIIQFENNEKAELCKGDTLLIKAHKKHKVIYTSDNPECIWLCVFISE